jgi:hypothetical protein
MALDAALAKFATDSAADPVFVKQKQAEREQLATQKQKLTAQPLAAPTTGNFFTLPVFATRDPTLLALAWGVYATWWAGLLIGVPIAYAAQRGRKPRRDARALVKPVAVLLGVMAAPALVAGIVGASLASFGAVVLTGDLGGAVPKAAHTAYLACLWTHTASYAVGFLGGGIVLPVWIWHQRGRRVIA